MVYGWSLRGLFVTITRYLEHFRLQIHIIHKKILSSSFSGFELILLYSRFQNFSFTRIVELSVQKFQSHRYVHKRAIISPSLIRFRMEWECTLWQCTNFASTIRPTGRYVCSVSTQIVATRRCGNLVRWQSRSFDEPCDNHLIASCGLVRLEIRMKLISVDKGFSFKHGAKIRLLLVGIAGSDFLRVSSWNTNMSGGMTTKQHYHNTWCATRSGARANTYETRLDRIN